MIEGATGVNLLPFSTVLLNPKTKANLSGVPDSNFIFFATRKANKSKHRTRGSRPAGSVLQKKHKDNR